MRVRLDLGESEAIALALENRVPTIRIDESVGRSVAKLAGLTTVGTLAVLERAKKAGLINDVVPLVDRLMTEINFFISPRLRAEIRKRVGE